MAGSLGFGRQYCIPKGKASAEYRFPQTVKHCVGLREPGSLDRVTTLKSATAHGPCFFTGLMPPKSQRPLPSAPIIHIAARFCARRRKTIHERFLGCLGLQLGDLALETRDLERDRRQLRAPRWRALW